MKIKLAFEDIVSENEDFIAQMIRWSISNILQEDCKEISFSFEDGRECHVTIR